MKFHTSSLSEFRAVAEILSLRLGQGIVVGLVGDLGAGKTTFVRAWIDALSEQLGLSSPTKVTSPTYSLQSSYTVGGMTIEHWDLYRLQNLKPQDLAEIGYEESLQKVREQGGAVFVEWPMRATDDALNLDWILEIEMRAEGRTLTLSGRGISSINKTLPAPATYFPLESDHYAVSAKLVPLGTDFGNGAVDGKVLQIDSDYALYRQNKLTCRRERLNKYYAQNNLSPETLSAAFQKLSEIAVTEWPTLFERKSSQTILCHLTGETIGAISPAGMHPPYLDAFDAIVSQIPEDVAIVSREQGNDWLSAIHLCSAGHWAPEDKIGKSFPLVHQPVPGIEPISRISKALIQSMIHRGPFVRFVWGFGSDDRLNHHPHPPPGWEERAWKGRVRPWKSTLARETSATPKKQPFFLRIERQVTVGLPACEAALFFIRVYYLPAEEIRKNVAWAKRLSNVIESMDADTLLYKGLRDSKNEVCQWLKTT